MRTYTKCRVLDLIKKGKDTAYKIEKEFGNENYRIYLKNCVRTGMIEQYSREKERPYKLTPIGKKIVKRICPYVLLKGNLRLGNVETWAKIILEIHKGENNTRYQLEKKYKSTVYSYLKASVEVNLIEQYVDGKRKPYRLTKFGRDVIETSLKVAND